MLMLSRMSRSLRFGESPMFGDLMNNTPSRTPKTLKRTTNRHLKIWDSTLNKAEQITLKEMRGQAFKAISKVF